MVFSAKFKARALLLGAVMLGGCGAPQTADENGDAKAPLEEKTAGAVQQGAADGPAFRCFGSEPFWSATLHGEQLILATPERNGPDALVLEGRWSDASSDSARSWIETDGGNRGLLIERRECIAESGVSFEFEADAMKLLGIESSAPGCCEKQKADG